MTQGVTMAAMPAAVHGPSGGRHGRRDEHAAGAFDEALGAPKTPHRAEAGAGAKARADAWRQAGTRPAAGTARLDAVIAKDSHAADNVADDKPTHGPAASLDQPDDVVSADKTDTADADDGLPTQMRAEQAISAIMTIAPIARQPVLASQRAPAVEGEAAADADAETAAPSGAKAALAAGAKMFMEQAPQAHSAPAAEQATARRTAPSDDVVADAATTAAPAPPRDHPAKAPTGAQADAARPAVAQARPAEATDPATDKSTAVAPGQARPGGGNDGADARQGGSDGRGAAREARRGEQVSGAGRVSVIAEQAAPAPVAPPLSANGAAIVSAVDAESGWRASAHLSSALPGDVQNNPQPMRELKIQLHPLELGVVTAHLRTVGEKLSVELKVDNHDAYHRLSADSDAIIKSLRSLGFDIDSVSIQQPQAAATTVARTDAGTGTGAFSRDAPSFQPGNSGSGGERLGGQASRQGERGGGQGNDAAQPVHPDRVGSSLYI